VPARRAVSATDHTPWTSQGLTVGAAGLLTRSEGIRQLEVIPVHVLDRPHLLHAAAIAAVCAALAIVLTLLLAGTLNDLTSTSAGGSLTATPTPVQSTSRAGWNLSPFTRFLRSPVRVPWTAGL
jgi:hypothetical protein